MKKNRIILLKIGFLFLTSIIFSSGHIENPDTHLRLTQARFLIENGSFAIEPGYGDITHGNIAYNDEGKAYSVYNPGQILLFVPITYLGSLIKIQGIDNYYIVGFIASFLGFIILGLITITLYKIGEILKIPSKGIFKCVLIFAFTSYCFAHAQDSYEHIYEALFILLAWYYLLKNRSENRYRYVLTSTLCLGFGLLFRTTAILALPGIMFLLDSWKQRSTYILNLLPFIFILLVYNYIRFDNPFDNGYLRAWKIAFDQSTINSFNLTLLPKQILGLLVFPAKGLLFFSPSIILGILGWRKGYLKETKIFYALTITIFFYLFIYGANFAWHGSAWSWGPRYIIPIIPLLYIGVFFLFQKDRKLKISSKLIILISLSIQLLSVSVFYKRQLVRVMQEHGDVFWDDDYFYSFEHFPLSEQVVSFIEVSKSTINNKPLNLFLLQEPWRNEARPASQTNMIDNSIDFNAYNFWWVRLQHLPFISNFYKIGALLFVGLVIILFLIILEINLNDKKCLRIL